MTAYKAPCEHGRYEAHLISILWSAEGIPDRTDCLGGTLLPPDSLVIVKEDGEWPEGVEVWWFCKTEGQRRKRHLRCDPLWNCKSDSGCGIRLFVPIGALTYSVFLSESERNAVVLDALAAAQPGQER